jgi:hypothetical protein
MEVTRDLVVSGMYQASDYEDGKYTLTGEISVHFNEAGSTNMMGPGSSNTATISMSAENAAKFGVGQKVKLTITAA